MKITRLGRGAKDPPRRLEVGRQGVQPASEPPKAAARAQRHVNAASTFAVSLTFSALLFVFFLVGDHGFLQVRRQRQQLTRLHAQVSAMAAANDRLEEEVAALKSDPKAVERIAREDLGFARPDEIVLVLPKGWRNRVAPEVPAAVTPRPPARP